MVESPSPRPFKTLPGPVCPHGQFDWILIGLVWAVGIAYFRYSVRLRTQHPLSPESAVLRFETIEGQLEVSLDLGDTADIGAWCTIDFNPGLGQKPQAAWSQWSKWSFHLPDWRVSAVREIWEGLKGP